LSGLGELMETMRRAQEKMAHTFNRFREDRTTGFKGFPGIYDGDFCATLTTKERVRLAFVKDDLRLPRRRQAAPRWSSSIS
jgi:hypothetical protein